MGVNELIDQYQKWCNEEGLPAMSADELLWEDCVNAEQKKWLTDFIVKWEKAEEMV